MGRISFIDVGDKKIFYLDFSNLNKNTILPMINDVKSVISKEPKNSVLTLSNFSDVTYDKSTLRVLEDLVRFDKPYVKAGALLGITGIKKVIYNTIMNLTGRKMMIFSDIEEAKEWLTQF